MKNNKKGFTLIELLAVIVVLSIIMVIATGTVTRAMKTAAADSFVVSYNTLVKEVKNKATLNDLSLDTDPVTCTTASDCASKYDLSATDYDVTVTTGTTKGYKITFKAKDGGKFDNITLDTNCASNATCTSTTNTSMASIVRDNIE